MRFYVGVALVLVSLVVGSSSVAQDVGVTQPTQLLKKVVAGMPKTDLQEIRVLTATFKRVDQTAFHTYRFPVIVYVLESAFTVEREGRLPKTVSAGSAFVDELATVAAAGAPRDRDRLAPTRVSALLGLEESPTTR